MMDTKSAVEKCKQCLRHNRESGRAPLVPIEATDPMDLLHLDFTKNEVSSDSEKELKKKLEIMNLLVFTDHFTWHTMAFITGDNCLNCSKCAVPSLLLYFWYSIVPYDG